MPRFLKLGTGWFNVDQIAFVREVQKAEQSPAGDWPKCELYLVTEPLTMTRQVYTGKDALKILDFLRTNEWRHESGNLETPSVVLGEED